MPAETNNLSFLGPFDCGLAGLKQLHERAARHAARVVFITRDSDDFQSVTSSFNACDPVDPNGLCHILSSRFGADRAHGLSNVVNDITFNRADLAHGAVRA